MIGDHARERTSVPFVIWFTGISGAGKSTIASMLETRLHERGLAVHNLDGDALRTGLDSVSVSLTSTGGGTFVALAK